MYSVPFPLSPSLWAATACAAPATDQLEQNLQTDVIVIGGGYAGLSTALHLAQRGISVTLLEAREIGFGGSGRNGGQVIPGLKFDPDDLLKMFGNERGTRLIDFAGKTADEVGWRSHGFRKKFQGSSANISPWTCNRSGRTWL